MHLAPRDVRLGLVQMGGVLPTKPLGRPTGVDAVIIAALETGEPCETQQAEQPPRKLVVFGRSDRSRSGVERARVVGRSLRESDGGRQCQSGGGEWSEGTHE